MLPECYVDHIHRAREREKKKNAAAFVEITFSRALNPTLLKSLLKVKNTIIKSPNNILKNALWKQS